MYRVRSPGLLGALWALGALVLASCDDKPKAPDAGSAEVAKASAPVTTSAPVLPALAGPPPSDPVGALARFLPGAAGYCVQIRSVPTRLEADRVAASIREQLSLDVTLIDKDLGERGTWWRVCVGNEASEALADSKARAWTREGGALRPFMDAVAPGQAAYQVLERKGRPERAPTAEQALALLRARPDDERPLVMVSSGALYGAVTLPPDASGQTEVAVIAPDGAVLPYDLSVQPEGCEACRAALSDARASRRLLGAGDVTAAPGEELLVEERSGDDDAVLSVLSLEGGTLKRVAWFLLGTSTATVRVLGDARALNADGEPGDELALTRVELSLLGDRLCALRERVQVLDLRRAPARELGVEWARTMGVAEQTGGAGPTKRLIAALDALGDADSATRVCAAYLRSGRDPSLASLCIARVSELSARGRRIAAVNAAGLLSEASEALRPAVAGPFFQVASALDEDPRLSVGAGDCETAPLVESVAGKRLEHVVRLARVRAKERVQLADLLPEVFVTGARDFGPDVPVGRLTASWLMRLKERLPAKAAAIEAALGAATGAVSGGAEGNPALPAAGAGQGAEQGAEQGAGPENALPVPGRLPSAGGSGYIDIQVHEDDSASDGAGDPP